jgi:D-alanine-D-alanine ligase-like ATP-grasp enzyme
VIVARERWRAHPLAWLHRAEARAIARELGVDVATIRVPPPDGPLLLRLSDPEMLRVTHELTHLRVPYIGPRPSVMSVCYDKLQATRLVEAEGLPCPLTMYRTADGAPKFPVIVKPRRGSDSLGVRLLRQGPLPPRYRSDRYIVQEYVHGVELTVAVLGERAGRPLEIALPPGSIYTFTRKYLRPARRGVSADLQLSRRARESALKIARLLGVNWAARVDFIAEPGGRLCFLECDVAPMIAARSAFAMSLAAAGIARAEQLALLTK